MASRILIVDDEPDTLGLIELTLTTAGHGVITAFDGASALELLRREAFDLVVLDIMMPDISGFDVVRTLQAEAVSLPPVVFLTAKTRDEDRTMGNSLGAKAYLTKPTTRGQLLDAIVRILGPER
jgi:DNA-binding response OmpR family regulator